MVIWEYIAICAAMFCGGVIWIDLGGLGYVCCFFPGLNECIQTLT